MVVGDASCDELCAQADDCIEVLVLVTSLRGQGQGTAGPRCLAGGLLTRGLSIFVGHDTMANGAAGCRVTVEYKAPAWNKFVVAELRRCRGSVVA